MGVFTYTDLIEVNLGKLGEAADHWKAMADGLEKLRSDVYSGLVQLSDRAKWAGLNAGVTKDFVRKAAKEVWDLHLEATSIWSVLEDGHGELTRIQRRAKELATEARRGNPDRADPDPGLLVIDGGNGTVKVMEAFCDAKGTSQRTKDMMQWYADTLTGLVSHAAEIDAAIARALKRSHGGDPYNAGHATYTSLDEDQLPRAVKLASLGDDANKAQRAELQRLWQSLSPQARAELWNGHKDNLLAAGVFSPTVKQVSPDQGSGPHGSEKAGPAERRTREKMNLISEGADWVGMSDASRHMAHYLGNTGNDMDLPVDKMMDDDEGFRNYVEDGIREQQDGWRERALEEFRRNGGQPVAIPVETENRRDYSFQEDVNENWYYAVGSTRSNVTGVVTVVPDANGQPQVGLDYQVNAWDRYNWDKNKGVTIDFPGGYTMGIPDGEMARLHTVGIAQEFDMAGSSSVKHYDLGSAAPNEDPLPKPDEPGREGGRTDPGREQQEGR
ncbi:hypothetical protein QFZ82_001925 [Streptomyces sp. V4I23]|uniref:hypothetical protein n=1 Tax=Streptomyces sp. V4I23 TaxID=3042282 RepID=UPI002781241C|nr:hypothetical protein [Streptomyces sp. V4I23]MDQ1007440.1 hypothetical protein [Streptomyces sp. V4I23]